MDVQLHAEGRRLLDERLATTQDKLEDIPRLSTHEHTKAFGAAQTQAQSQPQLQQHHRARPLDLPASAIAVRWHAFSSMATGLAGMNDAGAGRPLAFLT